jgi:hypothetical protein
VAELLIIAARMVAPLTPVVVVTESLSCSTRGSNAGAFMLTLKPFPGAWAVSEGSLVALLHPRLDGLLNCR